MEGKTFKNNKTNRIVTVINVSPDLIVYYKSPKGKKFESPINRFFNLYSEVGKVNPKNCNHRWTEITLFTSTMEFCILCDKKRT